MGLGLASKSSQPQMEFLAKPLGWKRPCSLLVPPSTCHGIAVQRQKINTGQCYSAFRGPLKTWYLVRVTDPLPEQSIHAEAGMDNFGYGSRGSRPPRPPVVPGWSIPMPGVS